MQKKLNNEITTVLQDNSNTHNPTQNNEHIIELLKKDVKYYADMADSRLETIKVQTKLIEKLEEQLKNQ
jgi:RNase H-fold protein (predicted Holliday junction resolvase)